MMNDDLVYWLKYVSLVVVLALVGDVIYRRFIA